ncbi:hypothetical protein [Halogeometricum limi]|uniref:DUF4177 domain-containing protein n=1 Tax=Halogeometricum limi TaxID=555875 RepID=A0A1I6I4V4_9EURY|nr:hypothetical protein [Halogeometricum limi]SFR61776.1 hypothetical protein SAMN04488124_2830 [Halogeometricum limi]
MSDDRPVEWEYKAVEPPKGLTKREAIDPTDRLNELGAERWEFTGTIEYDKGGTKFIVFKRPVSDE